MESLKWALAEFSRGIEAHADKDLGVIRLRVNLVF